MRAGELRSRVIIKKFTTTRDGFGGEIKEWTDLATPWAKKAHLTSREFFNAQKINNELTDMFIVRFRSDITTEMMAVHRGKEYNIIGAYDPDDRRVELHLLCKEVV